MSQAIVRRNEYGRPFISCNSLLEDEPMALYVNRDSKELTLSFYNGRVIALGRPANCPDMMAALLAMHEITIQSECGGLLAAGYRVGIRQNGCAA